MPRPTVARIHAKHLQHNLARARAHAPGAKVMACVKANAYGHGLLSVAYTLRDTADGFAVATVEEALTLRKGGIDNLILLLEGVHQTEDWRLAQQHQLAVVVHDAHHVDWLEQLGGRAGKMPGAKDEDQRKMHCWLKIDTGMHRLGVAPGDLPKVLSRLEDNPAVASDITLMTHFAGADSPERAQTAEQLASFNVLTEKFQQPRSCANSAAILTYPESHFDWIRPGYMLYGGTPLTGRSAAEYDLRPAMEFCSSVISIRDIQAGESVGYGRRWTATRASRIATVAAGYGDGYPRHAPDGTPVLINGQRAPLAGRVSMDMLTVDITELADVVVGSPVELWGGVLTVDDVAAIAGTIGYELLAGMPERVPRELVN